MAAPTATPTTAQSSAIQGVGTAFGSSAPGGLSSAQQAAFAKVQQAFAPPAPTKTTEPTVLTTSNIDTKNQQNTNALANYPKAGPQVASDNLTRNADQSFAEAPTGATMNDNGTWSSDGKNYALGNSNGLISNDPATQALYDQFTTLKGQMDATAAANIENIKNTFQGYIAQQEQANKSAEAGTYSLLTRGGSLQTASSSGIIQGQVSYGLQQIADLNTKEQAAVIAAQQAQQSGDFKLLDAQLSIAQQANKDKQAAAAKLSDSLIAAKQKLIDQQQQASKDSAIGSVMETGVTDPQAILKSLQDQGITNITADDISKTLANLSPDQKNIQNLMQTALSNGAPQSVVATIAKSKNYTEAFTAAGSYASTATGDLGLYQNYVRQAQAAGQKPVPFESWQNANEYNKAYSSAKGAAAGKAAGEGGSSTSTTSLSQDSITSKDDLPQSLKPYTHQSADGSWYLDLSSIGATQRSALINQAGDLPVITDKNQANDLSNIRDVNGKLQTIADVMRNLNSPSALARVLQGPYTSFSAMAQSNPKAAASGALNDAALDILKAISGVQGFRGNQSAIEQIKESLPKITDTQDTAAQKLSIVARLIKDRETGILGASGPVDNTNFVIRSEDQAKSALTQAAQKDSSTADQITQVLGATNPDTGQPYTYLEASQILGIDIPGLAPTRSDGVGGPHIDWGGLFSGKGLHLTE